MLDEFRIPLRCARRLDLSTKPGVEFCEPKCLPLNQIHQLRIDTGRWVLGGALYLEANEREEHIEASKHDAPLAIHAGVVPRQTFE